MTLLFTLMLYFILPIIWAAPPDGLPGKITRKELVELRQELNRVSRFATESVTKRKKIEEKIGKAIEMMKKLTIDTDISFKDEMTKGNALNEEVTKSIKKAHMKIRPIYNDSNAFVHGLNGFIGEDDVLKGEDETILEVVKEAKKLLDESTPVLDKLEKEYDDISAKFKHFVDFINKQGVFFYVDDYSDESGYTDNEIKAMFLGKAPIPTFTTRQHLSVAKIIIGFINYKENVLRAFRTKIVERYRTGDELLKEILTMFRDISSLPNAQEMDKFMKLVKNIKKAYGVLFEMSPEVIRMAYDTAEDLNAHRKKIVECEDLLLEHDSDIPQEMRNDIVETLKAAVVAVEDVESFLPTLKADVNKLIALVGDIEKDLDAARVIYNVIYKKENGYSDGEMEEESSFLQSYSVGGIAIIATVVVLACLP